MNILQVFLDHDLLFDSEYNQAVEELLSELFPNEHLVEDSTDHHYW